MKLRLWLPFVRDDKKQLLALSITARSFSKLPSELLEVENPVLALDFDQTAALRLSLYDSEMRRLEYEAMFGKGDGGADENTTVTNEVW